MKIALASDHGGFKLKEQIKLFLNSKGHEILDFGCFNNESCDYPDFIQKAAFAVSENKAERAVIFCGSGVGASIVANKVPGVRAALCTSDYIAEFSRLHNDSNVLAMGERFTSLEDAERWVNIWLSTAYEGGRHQNRLNKIKDLENSIRGQKS